MILLSKIGLVNKMDLFSFFKDRKRIIYDRTGTIPYLVRYYIFLKDRNLFPFNITLHKILVSDDPKLHDHPWNWGALILKGGYWEHSLKGKVWCGTGSIRFRSALDVHWLELDKDKNGDIIPCWSLFFMGRKKKDWGFIHNGKWIQNEIYLKEKTQQ